MKTSPLRYHPESRKPTRDGIQHRSIGLKHGFNYNPILAQHKINLGLEKLFRTLYKAVFLRYSISFRNLKTVFDTNYRQERIFEKRLFKYIDRVFYNLKQHNLRMKSVCFNTIRDHSEAKLLFERLNPVVTRIGLKTLAASSRIQRFRKALLNSSKKTKLQNQSLKARYLMAVCENIVSRKSVPKQVYKSFREWHLQSVLKKLSTLNEDQRDMVWQQKIIIVRLLRNLVTKVLRKVFWQIKTHNIGIGFVHKRLSFHLSLNYLVEKVSAPFIKHVLLNFPHANWNSGKMDAISLLKMCYFFKKLMQLRDLDGKVSHDKQRAGLILANVLQKRLFLSKRASYNDFASSSVTEHPPLKNRVLRKEIRREDSARPLFNILKRLVQRRYSQSLMEISLYSIKIPSKAIKTQNALNTLEAIAFQFSQQAQRDYLHRWTRIQISLRQDQDSRKAQDIHKAIKRTKLLRIKNIFINLGSNALSRAFQRLVEFSIEERYLENSDQQEVQEIHEEIPIEKKILVDIIRNQAVINAKLESKHRKKVHDSSIEKKLYDKTKGVEAMVYKLYQKQQFTRLVLQKFFIKWQTRVSFDDKKISEYENSIRILESEINVINLDIQQIEQARLEKVLEYLNRLEFVNSDLREIVGPHEKDLESQELQEMLRDSNYIRKRNFSI